MTAKMTAKRRTALLLLVLIGLAPALPARTGFSPGALEPPSGAPTEARDLFAGIDTRLAAIAATVPDAERRHHAGDHLEAVQVVAERARTALNPARLGDSAPAFVEILKHLRAAHAYLDRPEERHASELIAEKIDVAETGLAAAAGIVLEVTTEREALIPGETFPVQAVLWNSGGLALTKATVQLGDAAGASQDLAAGAVAKWELQVAAPAGISGPLRARFSFTLDGVPVEIEREVTSRRRRAACWSRSSGRAATSTRASPSSQLPAGVPGAYRLFANLLALR